LSPLRKVKKLLIFIFLTPAPPRRDCIAWLPGKELFFFKISFR